MWNHNTCERACCLYQRVVLFSHHNLVPDAPLVRLNTVRGKTYWSFRHIPIDIVSDDLGFFYGRSQTELTSTPLPRGPMILWAQWQAPGKAVKVVTKDEVNSKNQGWKMIKEANRTAIDRARAKAPRTAGCPPAFICSMKLMDLRNYRFTNNKINEEAYCISLLNLPTVCNQE